MSYEEFRHRIDTARNILVGAVPSPAGQIDQITYALMYKFMNDLDDQSAAIGGKRAFFTGDYEKYNWHKLMSSTLGAHERLELYRQAIQTMAKNPNIPELFRGIYQNAFLPFNSPNVLTMLLKEIDKFSHGENDDIGDVYEYLLSITGAQGDVGQFRTPRHIIKFIVEAVNPTKDDTVIDPACGTAGFLIAAYKHVKAQHDGKDAEGKSNDEHRLTADELNKIHKNYRGFDIDPTMVRTAKVNMYLHGFKTPDIINHDSLSSEDYWNDRYDVILANPPFMTPKGGIQPHKKFGISANRAEVLFVDYIASHLKPTGRAGIVVPEGIIFQSGKAYKELRKNLVENYLYAVVSMPAGIFQPYSGVKTSVLLFDKELAKQRDNVLFVKIENDGYSLGAQRRKATGDEMPQALALIEAFKDGEEVNSELAHAVLRSQIAESGDYNLSGDRYKSVQLREAGDWPLVELGDIIVIDNGNAFKSSEYVNSGARVMRITNVQKGEIVDDQPKYIAVERVDAEFKKYELFDNDLLMSLTGNVGRVGLIKQAMLPALLNQRVARLRPDETKVLKEYLFNILNASYFEDAAINSASGIAQKNLSTEWLKTYKIPLPPIEIQREVVAELDNYQKIIDAAQTIVKTYKPTIKINPEWPSVNLPTVTDINRKTAEPEKVFGVNSSFTYIDVSCVGNGTGTVSLSNEISVRGAPSRARRVVSTSDVLLSTVRPNLKAFAYLETVPDKALASTGFAVLSSKDNILPKYLYAAVCSDYYVDQLVARMGKGAYPSVNSTDLNNSKVILPSITEQKQIVTELEAESNLIEANKKLIDLYTEKIKSKIAEIWGE